MREHGSTAIALELASQPGTKNNRASQGDESSNGVNNRGTGEVMETCAQAGKEVSGAAHSRQPSVRAPSPVTDDRVNETGDADAVKKVAHEAGPPDHGARGDGRAGVSKGELEDPHGQERDACRFIGCRRALQEKPVIADKSVTMTEHEREADGIEKNAAKAGVDNAFHQHVHG